MIRMIGWKKRSDLFLLLFPCILWLIDGVPGARFTGNGLYCRKRPAGDQCCSSRDDDCTAPILVPSGLRPGEVVDHLCYCDHFCNREERNDGNDCCPDFYELCSVANGPSSYDVNLAEGSDSKLASFALGEEECSENGIAYGYGQVTKRNCQTCTCLGNRWQCDESICLIQESLLNQVQEGQYSWTAKNYSKFWGRSLDDGIRYRLGTLFPERTVENMNEILIKRRELPISFDAREKWPYLRNQEALFSHPDQGDCGSSWAFSTTQVATDRLAILSGGKLKMESALSPQQLLDCNQHKQKGCQGGFLDRAWWYVRKLGLVSGDCYPYTSGHSREPGQCQISKQSLSTGYSIPKCVVGSNNTVYKMTPPYRISSREEDIQTEILNNGPVQATFLVHEDFFMYNGGVYQRLESRFGSNRYPPSGYHSVKIFGWGEELGKEGQRLKYWQCSNWWGSDWGEQGNFRILRGENHCEVESFVIGAWAKQDYSVQEEGESGKQDQPTEIKARRRRRQRRRWRILRKAKLLKNDNSL